MPDPIRRIDTAERRARLGRRHHLASWSPDIETAATDLVGLHSSDPVTVYLSARARVDNLQRSDVETALYERRSLVRMLGMRRTMFVVPHDLAATMNVSCTRALVAAERRRLIGYLEGQDIAADGEQWLARVEASVLRSLEARGEATAAEIKKDVPELEAKIFFGEGKKWGGAVGVSTRVLFLLATTGAIVRARPRGTWVSSLYRWTRTDAWIDGGLAEMSDEVAAADLVSRWLGAYGPGTDVDIAWWTGWGKRRVRSVLAAIGAHEVAVETGSAFVLAGDVDPVTAPASWIALLPSLDSTVMGWKERGWYLGDHQSVLYDSNGNAGPTVWADGRIAGGWAQHKDGEVVFQLLEDVGRESRDQIEAEAARLTEWLSDTRIKARFPTPMERALMG